MSDADFEPDPTPGQAPQPAGMLEAGNIDLNNRPIHRNSDGSISTVRSASFGLDGKEVLLPTIADDGTPLSDDQAVQLYRKTGKHLGKFASPDAATAYAQSLHEAQAKQYLPKAAAQDDFEADSDTSFLKPEAKNRPRPTPQSATANDETAGDEGIVSPASKRTFEPTGADLPEQFRQIRAQLDAQRSTPLAAFNVAGNSALLGLGPAYVGAQNKLVSLLPGQAPTTYDAERAKAQAQLERDRGTLGTPGTIAAETIGGLAPALLAPEAGLASEISTPLARGVATGAAYGAAQGAGESISKGDTEHIGRNALEGAAAGGLTGGVLEGTLGRLSAHAAGEDNWLVHDLLGSDIKTQASPTERKVLADDEADVKYTLAADPSLRRQISKARGGDPDALNKLLDNIKARQQTVIAPHDELYDAHDQENPNGGYRVGDMVDAVEARIKDFERTGGRKQRAALEQVRDSLKQYEGRDTIIPPDAVLTSGAGNLPVAKIIAIKSNEAATATDPLLRQAAQRDVDSLKAQFGQATYNPDKIIPSAQARQILTDLQGEVHDALGGFNERAAYKKARLTVAPIQDAFNAHLNTGDPELVGQIRDMNRRYSALKNMEAVVRQRLNRSTQQNLAVQKAPSSLRAVARNMGGLGGGALLAASGHPVLGAAMVGTAAVPEVARGADMALARLIAASKKPGLKGDLAGLVQDAITKGVPRSVAMQFGGSAAGGEIHKAAAEIAP